MRTVIYARFSSQLQNPRSCADQIADCAARAAREGWTIVGTFADDAISGAAGIDARPQLGQALAMIDAGQADQLLAESTDRIARHQGDAYAVRERLEFAGARLFTLLDGVVDDINGTIKGLFDARFRKDLAARIKRGQRGTVADGRVPAGRAYGYRLANRIDDRGALVRGLRVIDDAQAAIVRRIFAEYAAGQSPRAIAGRLNDERVPGPTGGSWRSSTIAGDRVRQNGMLQNRLYVGEIVHNRTRKVTDPKTRRTLIKPNPPGEWAVEAAPHLRIIDDATWAAVQAMRTRHDGVRPERCRRAKHMLSGLVRCGQCGGNYIVVGDGKWGCGRHRDGRACSNNRIIVTSELNRRVIDALQNQMLHPDVVSAYVQEYHLDYARRAKALKLDRDGLERRHADAVKVVDRLVKAIAAGGDEFVEIRAALTTAKADRDDAAAQLAEVEALPVVALHPTVADDYRRQMAALGESLAGNQHNNLESVPMLRAMVAAVIATPAADKRGVDLEVRGRLAAILALASGQPMPEPGMITMERVKGIEPSS